MTALTRFLGDSPWRVFIKLLLVSLVVGYIMPFGNLSADTRRCAI